MLAVPDCEIVVEKVVLPVCELREEVMEMELELELVVEASWSSGESGVSGSSPSQSYWQPFDFRQLGT